MDADLPKGAEVKLTNLPGSINECSKLTSRTFRLLLMRSDAADLSLTYRVLFYYSPTAQTPNFGRKRGSTGRSCRISSSVRVEVSVTL